MGRDESCRSPVRQTGKFAVPTSWPIFRRPPGRFPAASAGFRSRCKVVEEVKETGFVRKKITFATEPGDRVPAWLLIPDAPSRAGPRRPAVLCLHQTIAIGKDEPVGLGKNLELAYARELAERGYITLAPDYPNFGEYKVDVYALGYASATMKAIWNNLRAVDLLCSLKEVDPNRIGVIGHSLGGHNAIFTALFDRRIKAVVSSCGFNAFPYYYKGNIAGWSHRGYMPRLREKYPARSDQSPLRFSRADRGPGPACVFHELTAARRQFRSRWCTGMHCGGATGLRAARRRRPPGRGLPRRGALLSQGREGAGI